MPLTDTIRCVLDSKGWGLFFVSPQVTVYDAVQQMADRDIGALAVMGPEQRLLGIFSERDYARKIILLGRSSRETTVAEVMSYPATTVTTQDTVQDCQRRMTTYRLRHLIAVDNGHPVGMISIGDLMKWIMSAQEDMIGHLHAYITAGA